MSQGIIFRLYYDDASRWVDVMLLNKKSDTFNEFLESCGIRRRLSCATKPQQNGVAEGMNKTLNDMARCFLIE